MRWDSRLRGKKQEVRGKKQEGKKASQHYRDLLVT